MAFQIKLVALVVVYFAQAYFVQGQGTLYQFCDLRESGVYRDPQIIDEDLFLDKPREIPAAAIARALERDPARKAVVEASATRAALNRQAAQARNNNRTKREVGAEYLAATKFSEMCQPREKKIRYSLDADGSFCQVVEPMDLSYYECSNSQCDYYNPFPYYQTYRCEPDTYVYLPAMVICEDYQMREQVFYVPINCCCRRYNCNMNKKYSIPQLL